MINSNNYLLMEVEKQSKVERVEVREDDFLMGYEPQCRLEIKEPGWFSMNTLSATLSGKAALHQFKKGDLVAVKLWFSGYKDKGEFVNHIRIEDIKLVKDLDNWFYRI